MILNKNFRVSVILPIYNGESTIQNTLDSLKNQTFKDFELICCIDGTNDKSLEILEDNRADFQQLVILRNEINLGLGPTMNRLVSNTHCEYIAVAEQDDYYYENRIQLQVDVLDKNKNIGLVSGIADFWDGEKITFRFPGILVNKNQYPKGKEMFLLNYRHSTKVVNSCMMFRKSIHVDFGLYFSKHYPNIPIDLAYFLRFCLVSDIYGIPLSLVKLYRNSARKSVTNSQNKHKGLKELNRVFYFEYSDIITKRDFVYAKTTQQILELGDTSKKTYIIKFIKFYLQNPMDSRWKKVILKKLKNSFK